MARPRCRYRRTSLPSPPYNPPIYSATCDRWARVSIFSKVFFARFEAAQLFVLCQREPVFEQENAASRQRSLDLMRLAHEFKIFIGAAKSHHAFDACTVVPGTIKQNHFAGGGQFYNITLKNHCLRSFSVGFSNATTRALLGFRCSVKRLIVPPLPAASRPSNRIMTFCPVALTQS